MSSATKSLAHTEMVRTLEYYGAPASESGDCTAAANLAVADLEASGAMSLTDTAEET